MAGIVEYALVVTYTYWEPEWGDSDEYEPQEDEREPLIRIISARRATDYERQAYFDRRRR